MVKSALQKRQRNNKNASLRKQPTFVAAKTGFPRNNVWGTTSEIPYWWRVVSLPRSGLCFWLVVPRGKGASTNQNHCQTWEVTRHQHGISALVSQTSFCGETSCKVVKCRLFFFSGYNNAKSVKNRDNTIGLTIKCNMDFKQIRRQSWGNVV